VKKIHGVVFALLLVIAVSALLVWHQHLKSPSPIETEIRSGEEDREQGALRGGITGRPQVEAEPMPDPQDFTPDHEDLAGDYFEELLDESFRPLIPESIPMRARIAKDVDTLRHESTQQSLAMLSEIEMFYWPGAPTIGPMPYSKEIPPLKVAWDVESIMSNRRFLKVMEDLSQLDKGEAAALVIREVNETLPKYKEVFRKKWEHVVESRKEHPGLSLLISNNPDHSPTLLGLRFKLLTLVLIAANLELHEAYPAIMPVVKEAVKQRDFVYGTDVATEADRAIMVHAAGLYNSAILSTAVRMIGQDGRAGVSGPSEGDSWVVRRLPVYYAAATPYDLLTRGGGPIPPDYSMGSISVRFHVAVDDDEFDSIVEELFE